MNEPVLWTRRRLLGALGSGTLTTIVLRALQGRLEDQRSGKMPADAPPMLLTPETVVPALGGS